jgi:hypothetical protein
MPIISSEPASARTSRTRMTGIGRVLVIVYGILALGATGRSVVQIIQDFQAAPVAYALSAVAAVVYILATLALVFSGSRGWYRVAWIAIIVDPALFQHPTVWSIYGIGYVFVPLVLPFFGLWWLRRHRPDAERA